MNCYRGVAVANGQEIGLHNVLFVACGAPAVEDYGNDLTVRGEHITADQCSQFIDSPSPTAYLTNCIFTALGADVPSPGTNNPTVISLPSSSGVFQTVGGGSYYLADASPYRNAGTTNLSNDMLARLTQTTTYPPLVYSNAAISTDLTLGPQALRNTGIPDLGYHYDPLDYAFGGVDSYANLTFTPGTAVGWFRTTSGYYHAGQGIHLDDSKQANFNGTAEAQCYWARCSTVQEGCNGLWEGGYGTGGITSWNDSETPHAPFVNARFTRCCQFVAEAMHFRDDYGRLAIKLTDCEIYNGGIGGYWTDVALTNTLLHRVVTWQAAGDPAESFIFRNCTLRGGIFSMSRWDYGPGNNTYVSIRDCAFDGTQISTADPYADDPAESDYDFNAFVDGADRIEPEGASDVVVSDFNWQTGPLGP